MGKTAPKKKGRLVLSVTLADCDVDTFTAGGPGGQHQNKSQTAIRIKHRDSGAVGESREHRSQLQNKRAAFRRMVETTTFKAWLRRRTSHETPEEKADRDMQLDNLRIEVRENGVWKVIG